MNESYWDKRGDDTYMYVHMYIYILFSKKKVDDIFNIDENMSQAHITRIKVIWSMYLYCLEKWNQKQCTFTTFSIEYREM